MWGGGGGQWSVPHTNRLESLRGLRALGEEAQVWGDVQRRDGMKHSGYKGMGWEPQVERSVGCQCGRQVWGRGWSLKVADPG